MGSFVTALVATELVVGFAVELPGAAPPFFMRSNKPMLALSAVDLEWAGRAATAGDCGATGLLETDLGIEDEAEKDLRLKNCMQHHDSHHGTAAGCC
jgi:hypothetical protein